MMYQAGQTLHSQIRRSAFSEKIWRCLERSERRNLRLRVGNRAETETRLEDIRIEMQLANWDRISSILDVNPRIVQIAEDSAGKLPSGIVALLPLNGAGVQCLTRGEFDGLAPDPAWIAPLGERPEAVYVWLIHMPGSFGRLLSAFASALEDYLETPVPIFSKAVSDHSARLQSASGFVAAKQFYPSCSPDLLVVLPLGLPATRTEPETDISVARSVEDIFKVFAVRSATYLAEQYCSYDEEFDGNDFCATHLLARVNGDPAGCVRLRFFAGFAKLERLAVREEYRSSRLAYKLARAGIEHCARKGYSRILGHSRDDLVRFWRTFGFKVRAGRPAFAFANLGYKEILLERDPPTHAVSIDASPHFILRPEGNWDAPGVYERAAVDATLESRRRTLLEGRMRRIRNSN